MKIGRKALDAIFAQELGPAGVVLQFGERDLNQRMPGIDGQRFVDSLAPRLSPAFPSFSTATRAAVPLLPFVAKQSRGTLANREEPVAAGSWQAIPYYVEQPSSVRTHSIT